MNDTLRAPAVEQAIYIDAPPEHVYATLTTAAGWNAWFTHEAAIDLAPGGKLKFHWKDWGPDGITTDAEGMVRAFEPGRRFVMDWESGAEAWTTVTFDLETRGSGTVVRLREAGFALTERDLRVLVATALGWGEALALLKFYLEHGLTYGVVPPPTG